MLECELLNVCGFFIKYMDSNNLACRSFINKYCRGDMMDRCERKKYRKEHGEAPPDNMMPSGKMLNI
ncbi:MAG: hypothetical protein JXJ19_01350 [Elusimicrobia bacterium]|nr:hypothetical protein [Elusimicrobiota bacterium]